MIDSAQLKRLLLVAVALLLVSAGASVALGAPLSFAGGLALGYVLGATPVASWSWIVQRALATKRGRILAVVLLLVKMAFYAGALYLCVTRNLVDPVGVLVGMLAVAAVIVIGVLWKGCDPAKEVT